MKRPILSTKAATLASLQAALKTARLLPQMSVRFSDWADMRETQLDRVAGSFSEEQSLIIRSSALCEDRTDGSMAGAFASVMNVQGRKRIARTVDEVFASYGDPSGDDAVLIQPMLHNTVLSGVAFTHDPTTGAPYRVISVHRGADTSLVTSGAGDSETYVTTRNAEIVADELRPVIAMITELERLFPHTPLDIEFALTGEEHLPVLLQVRPLILGGEGVPFEQKAHDAILGRVAQKLQSNMVPHPFLAGKSTIYGMMPDWNPAEIIGVRPRPLALSLYRYLVTDSTWAYQRDNYGYRNLRSFPLVQSLAGQPFVDVRLSFNSFIPGDLDDGLAGRLVDYYIDRLVTAPALHDKIEFEIVFSCYALDLPDRLKVLGKAGFSDKEQSTIADSLRNLTNRIIKQKQGLWWLDAQKIETLKQRHETIAESGLGPVNRIYWLLEDCRRYGTLPFAGLARAGFIAVQILRSLVSTGVFSEADYQSFMQSVDTVSGQFSRDLGQLDRASFLARYGHLRPGTYDITSPRYDEAPDLYLTGRPRNRAGTRPSSPAFSLTLLQMHRIEELLRENRLDIEVVSLMAFLQAGIEQREYAKFVFTRNLSDALAVLSDWGGQMGFSPDDLSYADIGLMTELNAGTEDPRDLITQSIAAGRIRYAQTERVWLPPLMTDPGDVYAFRVPETEPNYVTRNTVTGPVVTLNTQERDGADLNGAIVFIPSADPGFDWLFSHGIGGLVTAYGGVNSHMAIRAGELDLPAVIGAGEALFKRWSGARHLRIDCSARRVEHIA